MGAGKTGTSAIQEFLKINEELLQGYNLFLPLKGRLKSAKLINHAYLISGYRSEDNANTLLAAWEEIVKDIRAGINLISAEDIHSCIKYPPGQELLRKIKITLMPYPTKIIFYIRRDDQWIQSEYNEWIKSEEDRSGVALHNTLKGHRVFLGDQILPILHKYTKLVSDGSSSIFSKKNLLTREDQDYILGKNREKYEMIAREFLGRPDGKLFYENYHIEQAPYKYNLEDLTRIVSFITLEFFEKIESLDKKLQEFSRL